MQEIVTEKKHGFKTADLSLEERNKLSNVFAWLIQEDKKQNPALYQRNKEKND